MTKERLEKLFLGKEVVLDALYPGKNSTAYTRAGSFDQVLESDSGLGFIACGYTYHVIDYWRTFDGDLYGFYTAAAYPESEPGFVRIRLRKE